MLVRLDLKQAALLQVLTKDEPSLWPLLSLATKVKKPRQRATTAVPVIHFASTFLISSCAFANGSTCGTVPPIVPLPAANFFLPIAAHVPQTLVKTEMLNCIKEEVDRTVTKKVCDCVSELAIGILEEQGWPELLPFMFQCVQSGEL